MVVLLTLRADCSLVTLKPAYLSPYLPKGPGSRKGDTCGTAFGEGGAVQAFLVSDTCMCRERCSQ